MAKTSKFSEEKLLEAVVKYAGTFRGKIEATKLAQWASANIPGLEGVQGYHFTRPVKERDSQTGVSKERSKLSAARINEINAGRSVASSINTNTLLKSANPDKFLSLHIHEQRQVIMETRGQVEKLVAENTYLRRRNESLESRSGILEERVEQLDQLLDELKETQRQLQVTVARAMDAYDESERRRMLESIGVHDGGFDLNTYADSLSIRLADALSLNNAIRKHHKSKVSLDTERLVDGIDFD